LSEKGLHVTDARGVSQHRRLVPGNQRTRQAGVADAALGVPVQVRTTKPDGGYFDHALARARHGCGLVNLPNIAHSEQTRSRGHLPIQSRSYQRGAPGHRIPVALVIPGALVVAAALWVGTVETERELITMAVSARARQLSKIESGQGFLAALDQSGGSTPKALELYGIEPSSYSGDAEMFDLMQQMRARIITSPSFDGEHILGAILFEMTMDQMIEGTFTAEFLWQKKDVVPFLKVDKGLADEAGGVQLMKPIPDLADLLRRAKDHGVFGTKMRSVIKLADPIGIAAVVKQQFDLGARILDTGLVPILEPEIDIHSPQKAAAEQLLKAELIAGLGQLDQDHRVMLKLTLPDADDFYAELVHHPNVLRVVALSGGYSRDEATTRLARNHGVIASFSRALTEGLMVSMSDAQYDAALGAAIAQIYAASVT
jgi:fructose-bisphosphate aldolase class I